MRTLNFRKDAPVVVGKPRKSRQMNKTEARYALILEAHKRNGEIGDYAFEAITLKLANGVRFTPDFLVWTNMEHEYPAIELHEVKGGFIRDDARIKLRVAAKMYPCFTFLLCQFKRRSWTITPVERS